MIILNNIVPVFAVIALGFVLGRSRFVPVEFFRAADRLVYFILFPVMLFWKIGGGGAESAFNWPLNLAVLLTNLLVFMAGLLYVRLSKMPAFQVGSFIQLGFRFNTYLGLAVVLSAQGEEGVTNFGIIISLAIPFINVFAVSTLIWFSGQTYTPLKKGLLLIKALLVNPLILACLAGIAYASFEQPFPKFFDNTFRLLSVSALPLALLSIGQALTFSSLKDYLSPSLVSCVLKLVLMPSIGWVLLQAFGVTGMAAETALIYFSLPTAASAYILSTQMNSDPQLASAGIVLSTLLSFFSLSIALIV